MAGSDPGHDRTGDATLAQLRSANKGVTVVTDKSSFTPDEWKLLLEELS
jgi:hypothetical protein